MLPWFEGVSPVFFVSSTYTAPAEAIAAMLPEHRVWVAALYEQEIFFLSGRLVPPAGGFMMARGVTRTDLEAILATDPFRIAKLLTHNIIELAPTRWAPGLDFVAGDAS